MIKIRRYTLAQRLKRKREKLNLSYRELGKIINLSSSIIHRAENEQGLSAESFACLCRWLNTPMENFIFEVRKNA